MKIRPLQDRLVVKRLAEEEKTKGGIIIPDTRQGEAGRGRSHRRRQRQGPAKTARCARSTSRRATASCSASTRGTEIKIDGDEHLILREEDVLGIIEK